MAGRPLRFLALTGMGWIAIRVMALWPSIDSGQSLIDAVVPRALAEADAPGRMHRELAAPHSLPVVPPSTAPVIAPPAASPVRTAPPIAMGLAVAPPVVAFSATDDRTAVIPPPLRPTPPSTTSRLTGSAWLIARGGSNLTLLGGQLGASQAGARLLYALNASRRLSIAARIATPLHGQGREAAIGIEWRPAHLPFRLVAEQRIALDGGRSGPSVVAIGGIAPTPIAAGFELEAYGQAGGIVRDRLEGFADGAARVTRPVAQIGPARLDLGLGAWGGIQRDARRLDIGPTIGVSAPIAKRTVRLTLDWRERIGGGANPGSGPALSLGTDF